MCVGGDKPDMMDSIVQKNVDCIVEYLSSGEVSLDTEEDSEALGDADPEIWYCCQQAVLEAMFHQHDSHINHPQAKTTAR